MSNAGYGVLNALTLIEWESGQEEIDCEDLAVALQQRGWEYVGPPTDALQRDAMPQRVEVDAE